MIFPHSRNSYCFRQPAGVVLHPISRSSADAACLGYQILLIRCQRFHSNQHYRCTSERMSSNVGGRRTIVWECLFSHLSLRAVGASHQTDREMIDHAALTPWPPHLDSSKTSTTSRHTLKTRTTDISDKHFHHSTLLNWLKIRQT